MRLDAGGGVAAAARYPRPTGDAAALRGAAADQRTAAGRCSDAAGQCRSSAGSVGAVWSGDASAKALVSLNGFAALLDEVVAGTTTAAGALETYAAALETMQGVADRLEAEHTTLLSRYRSALAQTYPDEAEALDASWQAQATYADGVADLDQQYATAARTFDDAALACLRSLESTLPSFIRGHNESLDDWVEGMLTDWATRVPVLRDHMGLVRGAVWASRTALPAALIAAVTKSIALGKFLNNPVASPLRGVGLLGSFVDSQIGQRLPQYTQFLNGELGRFSQLVMGTDRTANLASIAANEGLGAAARTSGLLRGAGILGGVAATGMSAANVIAQGNPVDAFRENGAAYVADVAEVGFNASLTAAMIAPNPVTVGAVVVTGVVYAGAEVVANWDEITEFAGDAVDLAGRGYRAAAEAVDHVADTATDLARDAVSFLNPFD